VVWRGDGGTWRELISSRALETRVRLNLAWIREPVSGRLGTDGALETRQTGDFRREVPSAAVAVENDYNLLVHNLNELAMTISSLREEVERRRLQEAHERLESNQTDWVNLIGGELVNLDYVWSGLRVGVARVLDSEPGEAVFSAQPPSPPDSPP
jgi:hypothetical protein